MSIITIIVPAYNEEEVLELFYESLNKTLNSISFYNFELLFVNDGSKDNTLQIIKNLALDDNRISYLNLSRNYGKEAAMAAGFDYAKGKAIIIMDADLQHPPEVIPEMIQYWEQGYDDVYAKRLKREGEAFLKKFTSKMYYRTLQKTTQIPILPDAGDFRLLDQRCVEALKQLRESQRYTKGMYSWIGFKKKEITFEAAPRAGGETKWSYTNLIELALEGITSFTTFPLRLSSIFGFAISIFSFIYLIFIIVKTLFTGSDVSGYPSMMVVILFLGGIQLLSLGIIGEYLGRIFTETKNRPLYFIDEYSNRAEPTYEESNIERRVRKH
ncbi:glycosyltransferase family 2 protein [Planococcus glaciei]|uniref:glycosyltransferase family 2 protein n=1 Tax=Planococcus glaciei TaxID=459472 RepID=UPI001C72B138|nr:glycosyltransferase family 2 protein [Planococcus glaciei]MBX0313369.1 glycosyltransferase [Planococcus glaciei]